MKRIVLLAVVILVGLATFAQTGKEYEKQAQDAYKAKNYPKAFLDYTRAVETYEAEGVTDTALYYNVTITGYKARKYEELIPYAEKAIELGHDKAHLAYYIKAIAYDKLGKDEKYLETLKSGHRAFPSYGRISKKLAVAYLKQGMEPYKAGAQIVQNAEPLRESEPEKYKAEIEKANEKFEEARKIFEKAYEANPKEEQVLKSLAAVYQSLEMEEKAEKINSELQSL